MSITDTASMPSHGLAHGGDQRRATHAVAHGLVGTLRDAPPEAARLTLLDYGVGNMHSIRKALERAGAEVTITRNGADLLDAEAVVLPGVGAFGACMASLEDVRHDLGARLQAGVPCLGICIGMHLLCQGSDEDPGIEGIGLFDAHVQRFRADVGKVPHMGWNQLAVANGRATDPGLSATQWRHLLPLPGDDVYYVHSYYVPADTATIVQTTEYGIPFAATMATANTVAVQFHPEKSSHVGLRFIDRWVRSVARMQHGARDDDAESPTRSNP